MKKTYLKPTTMVVQIHHRQHLLSGSPYNYKKAPLETYDNDEDVIYEKNSIW